jgi:[NiFe] hydrogenase large subunit
MSRIIIDPVTRVAGHARIETEMESGRVMDAWVSAGLFRGMEAALRGRAPSDAFYLAQRISGVFPVSHGHAASMACEGALGIKIPNTARIVRNMLEAAQFLSAHILWFYQLAAWDYADAAAAQKADVAGTYALAAKSGTGTADFGAAQERLKALFSSGQLSIFSGNWFGAPGYRATPEFDLMIAAHYLQALEQQAVAGQVIALMGGKFPHFMTSIPGGTAWVPNEEALGGIVYRLSRLNEFVTRTMVPDMLALATVYKNDLATMGVGSRDLLSWGVFEDASGDPRKRFMPRGALFDGDLSSSFEPKPEKVIEYVDRSWYRSEDGNLNPSSGRTDPEFTTYDVAAKYSWAKTPRLDGRPVETGSLARMLVAYGGGNAAAKRAVDDVLAKFDVLFSVLGRIAMRVLEAKLVSDQSLAYANELVAALKSGDTSTFMAVGGRDGQGAGLWEAPDGSVGHWVDIRSGSIANYQIVTGSTWNCGPRDADGKRGPLEEALVGTIVADPARPLELLRVVHSFDPCLGSAAHACSPRSGSRLTVHVPSPADRRIS